MDVLNWMGQHPILTVILIAIIADGIGSIGSTKITHECDCDCKCDEDED